MRALAPQEKSQIPVSRGCPIFDKKKLIIVTFMGALAREKQQRQHAQQCGASIVRGLRSIFHVDLNLGRESSPRVMYIPMIKTFLR